MKLMIFYEILVVLHLTFGGICKALCWLRFQYFQTMTAKFQFLLNWFQILKFQTWRSWKLENRSHDTQHNKTQHNGREKSIMFDTICPNYHIQALYGEYGWCELFYCVLSRCVVHVVHVQVKIIFGINRWNIICN
jgi:hypothetical protein